MQRLSNREGQDIFFTLPQVVNTITVHQVQRLGRIGGALRMAHGVERVGSAPPHGRNAGHWDAAGSRLSPKSTPGRFTIGSEGWAFPCLNRGRRPFPYFPGAAAPLQPKWPSPSSRQIIVPPKTSSLSQANPELNLGGLTPLTVVYEHS